MANQSGIDHGQEFYWGKASEDYALWRDIYPEKFFEKLVGAGLFQKGARVLDLGTGTGVLPRGLRGTGAVFTGVDVSEEQIEKARLMSRGLGVDYRVMPAEKLDFPDSSFDAATACQCFFYFDPLRALPEIARVLRPGGRFAVTYFNWLPEKSTVAAASEELVLKCNPAWTGAGYRRQKPPDDLQNPWFDLLSTEDFDFDVEFTRESWNGRIRASRGVAASLGAEKVAAFDREHRALLERVAPESFSVPHQCIMVILGSKKQAPAV